MGLHKSRDIGSQAPPLILHALERSGSLHMRLYLIFIQEFTFNPDKLPTLKELIRLKYIEFGEEKKLYIIKEASHKWKDIASVISDDPNRISVLEQQHPGRPQDCLQQTLVDDFINQKPEDYSQDWRGLIQLLDDVDLKTLAEKIKCALSYFGSSNQSPIFGGRYM